MWSYTLNGKIEGPVTAEALRDLLVAGRLGWDDLVWHQGLKDWTKAGKFPELGAPPVAPAIALPIALAEPPWAPPAHPGTHAMGTPSASLSLDAALEALRATKPWVRFMGVMGIIWTVLMVILALAFTAISQSSAMPMTPTMRIVMPALYLVMALLQVPPILFLNRYASRIGIALEAQTPEALARALEAQKSFWRYVGIFTLVVLIIYGLVLLFGIGLAAFLGSGHKF